MTPAEASLWRVLQSKGLDGRKFRRQHSIGNYILDFYCPSERLAIEIDGGIHDCGDAEEYDELRTLFLNGFNIKVIRFDNEDVFEQIEWVIEGIRNAFTTPLSPP